MSFINRKSQKVSPAPAPYVEERTNFPFVQRNAEYSMSQEGEACGEGDALTASDPSIYSKCGKAIDTALIDHYGRDVLDVVEYCERAETLLEIESGVSLVIYEPAFINNFSGNVTLGVRVVKGRDPEAKDVLPLNWKKWEKWGRPVQISWAAFSEGLEATAEAYLTGGIVID